MAEIADYCKTHKAISTYSIDGVTINIHGIEYGKEPKDDKLYLTFTECGKTSAHRVKVYSEDRKGGPTSWFTVKGITVSLDCCQPIKESE